MNILKAFHKLLFISSVFLLTFSSFTSSQARVSDKVKFAENNPISDNMCKIYYATTGTIARVIAIFVIIVTAVGFFLGKVSWGIIISIAIAIGLMFSGRSLLQTFVGPKASSGCECKAGTSAFGLNCTARPIQAGT